MTSRIVSSPTSSRFSDGLPFHRSPSTSDFEIERGPKQYPTVSRRVAPRDEANYDEEYIFRESVSKLLLAKARPFAVSGRIPLDPSNLVLFFRSKSGITHSLDFPIDVEYNTPPALDVLIAACRPHQSSDRDDLPDRESLFYPPNLPLTATVEMSNHPIMEAVRNTLFPSLPTGHYLTAVRDKLEVIVTGGRMGPKPRSLLNDGRVATVHVTLPVRFRGGTLIIRDPDGREEAFNGRGGKTGDLEWTAFLPECDHEVETVQKGCRMSISYAVYSRTFGPSGVHPDPLINPSEDFLDLLSPVLHLSRGRKIAFYLVNDYDVDPSEVLAESLVPHLKGGDSLLYHAVKVYRLVPELHWTAGGYIWPVDHTVECGPEKTDIEPMIRPPFGAPRQPALRGTFSTYTGEEVEEADKLRYRVEGSGAIPFADADISILADWNAPGLIGKERVPLVTGGELEKLVVNVLLVVYVP